MMIPAIDLHLYSGQVVLNAKDKYQELVDL